MAGAVKHMKRSHRSYNTYKPFGDFERKARIKKTKADNKNFLAEFLSKINKHKEDKE